MAFDYNARAQIESDGSLWAEVDELPGCFATGGDLNELVEALGEAIVMCIEDDPDHPTEISLALHIAPVRVAVPA
jgi:predicted RNase H-like HicB family nuclease